MENAQIAEIIDNIASLLEIRGDNPFRLRAYKRAIEVIEALPFSLKSFVAEDSGDLVSIPGIGKGVSEKIHEILETGTCHTLDELLEIYPKGLLEMLHISGMGPKKVKLVFDELGVDSVSALDEAARAGALSVLSGMGVKTEEKIIKAIDEYRSLTGRFTLPTALSYACKIIKELKEVPGVEEARYAGSLRRWQETIGDLDILVTCKDEDESPARVVRAFKGLDGVRDIIASGPTKTTVSLSNGMHVDLRVVPTESFGAALQYFSGSKGHNIALRERARSMGLKISEYGVFTEEGKRVGGKSEEEVYEAVGLRWIPPEIRTNMGEIEAAESGGLPIELKREEIKGDLHMHTVESDGSGTIAEMAEEAMRMGYEYIAITEHSKATGIANGLDDKRLLKHIDRIDKFNHSLKDNGVNFRVLKGSEVDIRGDGRLDYPEDILKRLDIVVASIHSGFSQKKEVMTERVIRAIKTGLVDILAHPTGRLIGIRPPFEIDMEEVFRASKEHGTAIELNCYPERLDLKDSHLKLAREMGVLVAISTDSHSPTHMGNIEYGIHMARRAWLEPKDVLNTRGLSELTGLL